MNKKTVVNEQYVVIDRITNDLSLISDDISAIDDKLFELQDDIIDLKSMMRVLSELILGSTFFLLGMLGTIVIKNYVVIFILVSLLTVLFVFICTRLSEIKNLI